MSNNNKTEFEQILVSYPILLEPFRDLDPALIHRLFQKVDESSFTLVEWLDSLAALHRWLDEKGLTLTPEDSVGYISCAAKSVENHPTLNHLPSLINDFLEQYGCDLAAKK